MFVAISQYTRGLLLKAGVEPARITIIRPGIDLDRFSPLADAEPVRARLPCHDLVMLTVCQLSMKKGVDTTIAVLPELRKSFPGLIYVVVGSGNDLARLQALAKSSGVSDIVVFLGRVSDSELPAVYAAADVFAMPTRLDESRGDVEGFGLAFLEAGSQQVPAVGPICGGSSDAIQDGVTGYLVDPFDPVALRVRIQQLLGDSALRRRMGEAARRFALQPTDWSPVLTATRFGRAGPRPRRTFLT